MTDMAWPTQYSATVTANVGVVEPWRGCDDGGSANLYVA